MNLLTWLLKAAIFFALFAFALNNQQTVAVNFFFGTFWKAPLVVVVLTTFGSGLAIGVFLMMPRWWKKRGFQSRSSTLQNVAATTDSVKNTLTVPTDSPTVPRHGL